MRQTLSVSAIVFLLFLITDAYLGGICNANTTSGCLDKNAECKDSVCHCITEYTNIDGICKAGKLDNQRHRFMAFFLSAHLLISFVVICIVA